MKQFRKHDLNSAELPDQLDRLRRKLVETGSETALQHVFRESPDLCLTIGRVLTFPIPDHYAVEFQLFGDFRADLAVLDSNSQSVALIELEDAVEESIFRKGTRAGLEWSPRLEHGCSQIVDWAWKLDDFERTDGFLDVFGFRPRRIEFALVLGRDAFLTASDRRRLDWRSEHFVIDSRKVQHWTYDFLLAGIEQQAALI